MVAGRLRRVLGALSALFLGLVFIACSLPAARIERVATVPAGAQDRVRAALAADAAPWTDVPAGRERTVPATDPGPPALVLESATDHLRARVVVERAPDRVRVVVWRVGGRPDEEARAAWIARIDGICARLGSSCPGIGEWVVVADDS